MKLFIAVLVIPVLAACVTTQLEPVELCISSPQQINNELQCSAVIQNKQLMVLP